jgi:L-alanine-DL-glutamate epimerase-like enolase superfamily enzyme
MTTTVESFELYRLEVPTGRHVGDWDFTFDTLDMWTVGLGSSQGHRGWGYGQTVSRARYSRPTPWLVPMPPLAEMRAEVERTIWPAVKGQNPLSLVLHRPHTPAGVSSIEKAFRIALWDLVAQEAERPLYQLLGGTPARDRVLAYGSGLDHSRSDEEAAALFRSFIDRGFRAVKVKAGDPDPHRDVRRLQVVREAVGDNVEISIDVNEAWTLDQALERLHLFEREGIKLVYVEDPLRRDDIAGLVRLNAETGVDVAGHDYLVATKDLRVLVEQKAVSRLRVCGGGDINWALACADIAVDHGIPMIAGNSPLELGVHGAVALGFERLEFSDLGWNRLTSSPVRFEDGYAVAPSKPGIGLDPDPEMLERFSRP